MRVRGNVGDGGTAVPWAAGTCALAVGGVGRVGDGRIRAFQAQRACTRYSMNKYRGRGYSSESLKVVELCCGFRKVLQLSTT